MNMLGTTPARILSDNELYVLIFSYLGIFCAHAAFCVYLMTILLR